MSIRAKQKKRVNLATEILSDMKKQLTKYRIALVISLVVNMIQATMWLIR